MIKKTIILLLTITVMLRSAVDLEEKRQDFVLETKQIIIPGYPHAFNPSIIRFNDAILMCVRVIPNPAQSFTSWIGLIFLDDNFEPISDIQKIIIRNPESTVPPRLEDGRLIIIDKKLYVVYSDNEDPNISKAGCRLYVAQLDYDGKQFIVKHHERLSFFEGNDENRREKNWVPFEYQGNLLLAYSLDPHLVFKPLLDTSEHCETFSTSPQAIDWQWGILRGGTPAILYKDHYLSFFHSSKKMVTVHSQGREILHYFMGAYLFSPEPPFTITHMSPEPIIGKNFYHGKEYKPYWGSIRVVFPGGYIDDENYIWIAYGRQDHETWIAKLDKKKLYESLVPVPNTTKTIDG